jgi:hypothetical protein
MRNNAVDSLIGFCGGIPEGGDIFAIIGGTDLAVIQPGSEIEEGRIVIFQGGYHDPADALRTLVFDGVKEGIKARLRLVVPRARRAPALRHGESQKKRQAGQCG